MRCVAFCVALRYPVVVDREHHLPSRCGTTWRDSLCRVSPIEDGADVESPDGWRGHPGQGAGNDLRAGGRGGADRSVAVGGLDDSSCIAACDEHEPHEPPHRRWVELHKSNGRAARSRDRPVQGELSTEVHQLVDGNGLPLATPPAMQQLPNAAPAAVAGRTGHRATATRPDAIRGDNAYSTRAIRKHLREPWHQGRHP